MISKLPDKASRMFVYIRRHAEIWRLLGECLLTSSLPGKASRAFVDIGSHAEI